MKWFFRIFFVTLGIIILIPIVIVLMLIDNSKPPVDLYRSPEYQTFETTEVLLGSVDNFLADAEHKDLSIELSQDQINVMLFKLLQKDNPNYLIDDEAANKYYMVEGDDSASIGVVGAWTKVRDDKITIKARVDLIKPFTVGTSVTLTFKLDFNDDDPKLMVLELTSAKIGNLPLPRTLVNTVLEKAGVSLKDLIEPKLNANGVQFGTFDEKNWTLRVDKIQLIESFLQGSGQEAIVNIVKMLIHNEWLDLTFEKSKVKAELKTTKLYFDYTLEHVPTDPTDQRLKTEAETDAMLKSKGTTFLLSSLSGINGELYINLTELEINKLLDFYVRQEPITVKEPVITKDLPIGGQNYKIEIEIPTMEIYSQSQYLVDGGMHLNVKIAFYHEDKPTERFVTNFMIELVLEHSGRDLKFRIGQLRIGAETILSEEDTAQFLQMLGADQIIDQNMVTINNFLNNFASGMVEPKGYQIYDNYLRLTYQGTSGSAGGGIIDTLQGGIFEAIGGVTTTDPAVQEIIDQIPATPEELTPEQIQNLLSDVDNLSPEQIAEIQTALVAQLGESVPDINQLLAP